MSGTHSLPFSASSPQSPTSLHAKRNSLTSQLPLPTSLSASTPLRPTAGTTISTAAGPSSSASSPRAPTTLPSRPTAEVPSQAASPIIPSFSASQPIHSSSTHAGGIHPSASFFRPSRPNQYSRPNSDASSPPLPQDSDIFHLTPLTKQYSHGSDERPGSIGGHGDSLAEDHIPIPASKRTKHSREPLLPIGGRPGGLGTSRTNGGRERSGTVASSIQQNRSVPARIMRNSLDRVYNLTRGMSFDSLRKSTSSRTEPRPTMDSKFTDEERGAFEEPISALNIGHFKDSGSSGVHHLGPSLSLSQHSPMMASPSASPSPDPSFNPYPPERDIPLSAVPVLDPDTHKPIRRYQLHPSRNRFFFRGHILTGGDSPWAFLASFSLLLTIAGVWFGTTCVWWWKHKSPAVAVIGAYLALLTISSMLATATCDPGILPRDLDLDPPYPATSPSDGGNRVPMPRDLKVRQDVVRVKYCPTCRTYRPPRSSHCKMCDNCVDGCDHHCQWVNNCVGRRNYTSFFVLLLSATTTAILVICTSALHLFFLTRQENTTFKHALSEAPGSAIAFSLSIAVIWPVAALLSYHMRLLLLNITTIEQIRNQAHKTLIPGSTPLNPFSHGNWKRNLVAVICRPIGPSWLDGAGIVTEDKREVNPGMLEGSSWDRDGDGDEHDHRGLS